MSFRQHDFRCLEQMIDLFARDCVVSGAELHDRRHGLEMLLNVFGWRRWTPSQEQCLRELFKNRYEYWTNKGHDQSRIFEVGANYSSPGKIEWDMLIEDCRIRGDEYLKEHR